MANQKTNIWIDGTQAGATLKQLQKETAKLNAEIKNLPRNSDEYKKKVAQLKEANAALAEHRNQIRAVSAGFDQAKESAKSMLSQFAPLAIGIGAVTAAVNGFISSIGSALKGVVEYDAALADLQAVTGANDAAMNTFASTAQEYSTKYGESAADIVTAIKLAGSARPELLENAKAMSEFAEKAIILAKASGDDVPTSINNLAGTLNAFEKPASAAGEVMDTLANAAQLGVKEIPYLTEAFTKFGGIAEANNVSIAESAASVELLGKKFPDAASAGTGLRNVMLKLSATKALPQEALNALSAYGVSLEGLEDKSKPFSKRLELLKPLLNDNAALVRIFGTENVTAAQTLIAQSTELGKLTKAYGKANTAQEQAERNMATISQAYNRATEALKNQFLGLQTGSKSMVAALDFVAKNIGTILHVLGSVISAFALYKTTVASTNLVQRLFADENGKMNLNLKQLVTNMKSGQGAAGSLGNALKGIGWTALISLAVEFGRAIMDVASGAQLARFQVEQFQKMQSKGADIARKYTADVMKGYEKELQAIELKASAQKITEQEAIELRKKATEAAQEELKTKLKTLYSLQQEANKEREAAQAKRDKLKAQQSYVTSSLNETKQYALAERKLTLLTAKEKGFSAAITEVRSALDELTLAQFGNAIAANESLIMTKDQEKAAEKARKMYEDWEKQLAALIKQQEKFAAEYSYEERLSKYQDGLNKELFILQKSIEDKYQAEIEKARELSDIEGKIGLKAKEQYSKLLLIQDRDYELQAQQIREKYAAMAREKAYEDQKQSNLNFLAQEASYQDALVEIKVARAQAAYNKIDEKDTEARKAAFEKLKQALTDQYALEKQRKIESLLDQYSADQISQKELHARKLEAENVYLDKVAGIHEENAKKLSEIATERLTNALNIVSQAIDTAMKVAEISYKKQLRDFEKQQESEKNTLNEKLNSNQISQQQYNERVAQMDKEAEERKNQLQSEYGRKKKSAAKTQALINGALAVTQAFAQLGPIAGAIAAALVAVNTAAQVAIIDKQEVDQFYEGGYSNQPGTRTVRGAKDGKTYRARYLGKHKGGMLPSSPSLILASEKGSEYFVPYNLMRNQTVVNHVAAIEAIRTNQMAAGGYTTPPGTTSNPEDITALIMGNTAIMNRLYNILNEGIQAKVSDKNAKGIVDKANKIENLRA